MKTWIIFLFFATLVACGNTEQQKNVFQDKETTLKTTSSQTPDFEWENLEKAYFASGCFWCVEAIYESVFGVRDAVAGYSGGHTKNPTYTSVSTGKTGHAESVMVVYDPNKISFAELVDVYFNSQDVTQQNGQGPDSGSQYRSIIFYQNEEERQVIKQKIHALSQQYKHPIAAEVLAFEKFWKAEAYHQDYKKKNPNNPYVQNVSNPRLKSFKKKSSPELLKENKE